MLLPFYTVFPPVKQVTMCGSVMKKDKSSIRQIAYFLRSSLTGIVSQFSRLTFLIGYRTINGVLFGSWNAIGYYRDSFLLYPAIHLIIHVSQS